MRFLIQDCLAVCIVAVALAVMLLSSSKSWGGEYDTRAALALASASRYYAPPMVAPTPTRPPARTGPCSANCVCGCQETGVCDCSRARVVPAVYTMPATVYSAPTIYEVPTYSQAIPTVSYPSTPVIYSQPAPTYSYAPTFQPAFGGVCVGGNCSGGRCSGGRCR